VPDSAQGLFLLVLTMPGIVGFFVFSHMYCNRIESSFDKFGYIVLLNIVGVLGASIFFDLALLARIRYDAISFADISEFTIKLMLPLTACSSMAGALLAFVGNAGRVQRFLIKQGLTRKTAHGSVLADVIATYPDAYLKVRFKGGGYVIGHPRKYSLMGDEHYLFLEKAARRPPRPNDSAPQPPEAAIDGPGILLLSFDEVACVEVL